MPTIFISHSSQDDTAVTRLHDALEAARIDAWVDHIDGIQEGDNWNRSIQAALNTCNAGLFVLSPDSVRSEECEGEYRHLLKLGKPLYTALIRVVPDEDFPYRLGIIQYADLTADFDGGVKALIAAITGRRDLDTAVPAVKRVRPITGHIPRPLRQTPIRGRDDDLRQIRDMLLNGPTCILEVGGRGKSRLAAEIALTSADVDGAIWHTASDVSLPDDVLDLLKQHFDLEPTAPPAKALDRLRNGRWLVVLDNAEAVPEARRADYIALVDDLSDAGAQVLLTSRLEWADTLWWGRFTPPTLPREAACQIARDMGAAFGVKVDMDAWAEKIASAARCHPGLIEQAVGLLVRRSPEKVMADLEALRGQKIEEALKGFIHRSVDQMTAENGPAAEGLLRRLLVFRRGFWPEAALAVLSMADDDALYDGLDVLQSWKFATMAVTDGRTRYDINPLVIDALGGETDEAARRAHYDYYKALAREHHRRQDYAGLDPDSENLAAAFEWAFAAGHYKDAYWLASACADFLRNRGRFRQRMEWTERVAEKLKDAADDYLRGAVLNSLGIAYADLAQVEDRAANLRRAVAAYTGALRFCTPEAAPLNERIAFAYATTQNNLGIAYADLAQVEDRAANLRRAVDAFTGALRFYTPEAAPLNERIAFAYAMTQNNLGTAYADLAQVEDRAANLRRAVAAFTGALRFLTPEAAPLDYAMTQNNLGIAYRNLSEVEDRAANLRRAVDAYAEALRFYTPEAAPLDYAMTQNNLGAAYRDLSEVEDRAAHLRQAVAAFTEALRFHTPEAAPLAYATTQYNLGNAYLDLAQLEDRAANLRRAVDAFIEALRFYTPEAAPLAYATTQHGLGIVQKELGDLPAAVACWQEAERYYRQMGAVDDADLMLQWIARAEGGQ